MADRRDGGPGNRAQGRPHGGRASRARRSRVAIAAPAARTGALLVAGLALATSGCGGDDEPKASKDPFTAVQQRPQTVRAAGRAAPRWEPIARVAGAGERTVALDVSRRAIQWRARWRCTSGRIALSVSPPPASGSARHDGRCPGSGRAEWIRTGAVRLRVAATARWSAVAEQQVDTPLREPPLASMRSGAARVVARGRFYGVERRGRGRARLYRLPGGRLALRLEDFRTAANTDLFVWLSAARRPRTTQQSFRSRHVEIALLKATIGDQNYLLPRRLDPDLLRSIVIWCQPVQIAYAAAALSRR